MGAFSLEEEEKVYLEAAYPRPRHLAITLFVVQAVLTSAGKLISPTCLTMERWLIRSSPAGGCIVWPRT